MKIKAILSGFGVIFLINALIAFTTTFFYDKIAASTSQSGFLTIQSFFYLCQVLNVLSHLLGGFIAAKIAKKNEVLHGFIVGVIISILSILSTFFAIKMSNREVVLSNLLSWSFIVTIIVCSLGALIQKKIYYKKSQELTIPLEKQIENLGNNDSSTEL